MIIVSFRMNSRIINKIVNNRILFNINDRISNKLIFNNSSRMNNSNRININSRMMNRILFINNRTNIIINMMRR